MGQGDVIEVLKKSDKPLTAREIAIILENDSSKTNKISADLNKMIQYGEVGFKEIPKEESMNKYHCKRRMRAYFAIIDY